MTTGEIRIGVSATLVGPYAAMGADGIRGFELALAEIKYQVAGRPIVWFKEPTNAIPDSAVQAADSLFKQRVDFIVGPLSGNEGLAIRDYAKLHPNRAFINGSAGAQDMTLRQPAANFFSFLTNGVQWVSGLGSYAYHTLGYKRMATLGEAYMFPYGQIGGFIVEYCPAGGRILRKLWVSLGTTDYQQTIAQIPKDADALLVALGGSDALNFLEQYYAAGGRLPIVGGTLMADLAPQVSSELAPLITGMVAGSPIADSNPTPTWQKFVTAYRQQFPDMHTTPSLVAFGYYVNTRAALLALEQVNGDLSDGQRCFMQALSTLQFESPTGLVRLDHNRNAIATTFLTQVQADKNGKLSNKIIQVMPEVNQTLGMPEDEYLKLGSFDRNNPNCLS